MTLEQRQEVYRKAVELWGESAQVGMLLEESIELSLAARKLLRNLDDKSLHHMLDEAADVEIMIEQMKMIYPGAKEHIDFEKDRKVMRLEERLKRKSFED